MSIRPDKYPDWALTDQVDPVSKQNNVIEPPIEKKTYGWAFEEKGARNWFNWLSRYTVNWIKYLDAPDPYTVSTLPTNATFPLGKIIYVSDASGGGVPAFNDGTNWLRVTDRSVVS